MKVVLNTPTAVLGSVANIIIPKEEGVLSTQATRDDSHLRLTEMSSAQGESQNTHCYTSKTSFSLFVCFNFVP